LLYLSKIPTLFQAGYLIYSCFSSSVFKSLFNINRISMCSTVCIPINK
jgi:hypothetical protein